MKTIIKTAIFLTIALFGFYGCSKGPSAEELQRISDLEAALEQQEALVAKESQRAAALEEAKRLAEEASRKSAAEKAASVAELGAQIEREKQEKARLEGLVNNLNSKSETFSLEQKSLQDALAKARLERERTATESAQKVKAVEAQLARSEASKQSEIQQARESALAEAIARMEERAAKAGYTAATDVAKDRKREDVSVFLKVQIAERNFRNNTRRYLQRVEGEQ